MNILLNILVHIFIYFDIEIFIKETTVLYLYFNKLIAF
jgi:hypothetical protein